MIERMITLLGVSSGLVTHTDSEIKEMSDDDLQDYYWHFRCQIDAMNYELFDWIKDEMYGRRLRVKRRIKRLCDIGWRYELEMKRRGLRRGVSSMGPIEPEMKMIGAKEVGFLRVT